MRMLLSGYNVNKKIRCLIFNMTPEICKAARALTSLTQKDIAVKANISTQTVADFERGARTPHLNNLLALRKAFEDLGITFIENDAKIVGLKKAL